MQPRDNFDQLSFCPPIVQAACKEKQPVSDLIIITWHVREVFLISEEACSYALMQCTSGNCLVCCLVSVQDFVNRPHRYYPATLHQNCLVAHGLNKCVRM